MGDIRDMTDRHFDWWVTIWCINDLQYKLDEWPCIREWGPNACEVPCLIISVGYTANIINIIYIYKNDTYIGRVRISIM